MEAEPLIDIVESAIDTDLLLQQVSNHQTGAVVLFLGNTREFTGDKQTTYLSYECYPKMARQKLSELRTQAIERWNLVDVAIVHRIGQVDLGETSVAIAVSSEHRKPAFEAGNWLIDTLKQVVPIWKKEVWSDGSSEWVHPDDKSNLPS